MKLSNFFSGTSGLLLPVANKAHYPVEYRESSRLQFYSSLFNSIEINSTFRKIPMHRTIERWTSEVGTDFRFTFKIPEVISHASGLEFPGATVTKFLQAIRMADSHAGCILLQFPASLKADHVNQFHKLLEQIRHGSGKWALAVEFRDPSWYDDSIIDLMTEYSATYVLHDFYSMKSAALIPGTGSTIYLRFHGPEKGYRGTYSSEYIISYAEKIRNWLNDQLTVYVYFNNTLGEAITNLQLLNSSICKVP